MHIIAHLWIRIFTPRPPPLCKSMHWIHLCDFFKCPSQNKNGGMTILRWSNYKRDWLTRVYNVAIEAKTTLLLFKTVNFICDEKRTGTWAKYSSLYRSFDNKTIEDCYQANKNSYIPTISPLSRFIHIADLANSQK